MSLDHINVLLVEDNPGDARLLREAIREAAGVQIHLTHHSTLYQAVQQLSHEHFDIIMLDLSLPDAEGLDTLVRMNTQAPTVPIVVLTGNDDEALAILAVREGAQDYLVKGQVNSQLLVRAMRYATERKRAVEALQRSEEYFRALIENALDVIAVLTADTKVGFASPSFERVLGYPPAMLLKKSILPLTHPDDWELLRSRLTLGLSMPDVSQSFEFRIRHLDGSWRVLEVISKRFDSPELSGLVLNARDVTERKHSDSSMRELNDTLETVIRTSPVAIYSIDLDNNVRTWNPAAERIFGFSQAEVLNRTLPIIPADLDQEHKMRLAAAKRGDTPASYEAKRLRKDGSKVDVTIWSSILRDGSGRITGLLFIAADDSERKRLEEQFRQSQKMEAVGRLAGGVAHDFNNLLTVITGYGQMLVDETPPGDERNDNLQEILRAADRASALTKQLLAFSRQQIVQPKVVDLNLLVADMDKMLRRLMGEDIEILFRPASEAARIRIDPGQAEQVIVNLAVNARDAMPQGGKLTIECQIVRLDSKYSRLHPSLCPGDYVLLAVCDNGVGIVPEVVSHLFEPFFTTKEIGRGTGLGLSTSYGIVKQNRGDIAVYTEQGIGTTFKIYLPRVLEDVAAPISDAVRPDLRGSETILVVEDETGVRRVVVEMLEQKGYHVLTAERGEDAIEICRNHSNEIDLLITDVIMPQMSGRELAKHLSNIVPDLKVLYVSGYTDHAIIHHGVLEPGTNFLQKPFTPDMLAGKVREVLTPKTPERT